MPPRRLGCPGARRAKARRLLHFSSASRSHLPYCFTKQIRESGMRVVAIAVLCAATTGSSGALSAINCKSPANQMEIDQCAGRDFQRVEAKLQQLLLGELLDPQRYDAAASARKLESGGAKLDHLSRCRMSVRNQRHRRRHHQLHHGSTRLPDCRQTPTMRRDPRPECPVALRRRRSFVNAPTKCRIGELVPAPCTLPTSCHRYVRWSSSMSLSEFSVAVYTTLPSVGSTANPFTAV